MSASNRPARYKGALVEAPKWRTTKERVERIKKRCAELGITQTEYMQLCVDEEQGMSNPVFEIKELEAGYPVAVITYEDGSMFTTGDWQGPQPASESEIGEFSWYSVNSAAPGDTTQWRPAIMLLGYPRML